MKEPHALSGEAGLGQDSEAGRSRTRLLCGRRGCVRPSNSTSSSRNESIPEAREERRREEEQEDAVGWDRRFAILKLHLGHTQ